MVRKFPRAAGSPARQPCGFLNESPVAQQFVYVHALNTDVAELLAEVSRCSDHHTPVRHATKSLNDPESLGVFYRFRIAAHFTSECLQVLTLTAWNP